jgi:prepilin-type N-terminal cleavage/methylation domain-containing protein
MIATPLTDTRRRAQRRTRGFTLPEALAALAVAALLAVMAVPTLRGLLEGHRVKTASFELFMTLNFARSEAIKRATPVTIAPSGAGWHGGWRILDATGKVLKFQPAFPNGIQITGPDNVVYERDGRMPGVGVAAAFDVAVADTSSSTAGRCVRVELTGRPATRKGGCS